MHEEVSHHDKEKENDANAPPHHTADRPRKLQQREVEESEDLAGRGRGIRSIIFDDAKLLAIAYTVDAILRQYQ